MSPLNSPHLKLRKSCICKGNFLQFQIPATVHDEILRLLLETDPETTEQILKRLSNDPW